MIVLVATPAQAQAVALGEGGLCSGAGEHKPLLVVMGTIAPNSMQDLQRNLEPSGVRVLDAPVSGGIVKARDATFMMGGPREACDALRPLMQSMGSTIFYFGTLGSGQATKVVNNLVGITTLMIAAEAYRIGLDNGLFLPDAMPIFEESSGRNFFTARAGNAP